MIGNCGEKTKADWDIIFGDIKIHTLAYSEVNTTSRPITTDECFERQQNETLIISQNSIKLRKFYLISTILNKNCKYPHCV